MHHSQQSLDRRRFLKRATTAGGVAGLAVLGLNADDLLDRYAKPDDSPQRFSSVNAMVLPREKMTITKVETMLVKPRWLYSRLSDLA